MGRMQIRRHCREKHKAMLGFYILLMCMKVRPAVGAVGAISFGLSSFFILYLGAGHATKMNAITYIAPMLGGILFAFRRHALKGSLITAFFLCLHLGANHFQMTYYALFLLGIVAWVLMKLMKTRSKIFRKILILLKRT